MQVGQPWSTPPSAVVRLVPNDGNFSVSTTRDLNVNCYSRITYIIELSNAAIALFISCQMPLDAEWGFL